MAAVTIYTSRICAYCFAAKRLLGARGIPYQELDITGDAAQRAWLVRQTGRRTVPQIFIGDRSIGGYEELKSLDRAGKLASMVAV